MSLQKVQSLISVIISTIGILQLFIAINKEISCYILPNKNFLNLELLSIHISFAIIAVLT